MYHLFRKIGPRLRCAMMFAAIACVLGMVAAAACAVAWRRLRATTLAACCAWTSVSLVILTATVAGNGLIAGGIYQGNTAHLEYLAGITTVAPFVALLGAKRPQNAAWQWIVAALIGLLAFQDLRDYSIGAAAPSPHAAWQWLLAALVAMQFFNYLPTRFAPAAGMALMGQVLLLAGILPWFAELPTRSFSIGLAMQSLAVLCAAVIAVRPRPSIDIWQTAWCDFRDRYGLLWGLRVAERVNAVAASEGSAIRLRWTGFRSMENGATASAQSAPGSENEPAYRAFRSLLARFVGAARIEAARPAARDP